MSYENIRVYIHFQRDGDQRVQTSTTAEFSPTFYTYKGKKYTFKNGQAYTSSGESLGYFSNTSTLDKLNFEISLSTGLTFSCKMYGNKSAAGCPNQIVFNGGSNIKKEERDKEVDGLSILALRIISEPPTRWTELENAIDSYITNQKSNQATNSSSGNSSNNSNVSTNTNSRYLESLDQKAKKADNDFEQAKNNLNSTLNKFAAAQNRRNERNQRIQQKRWEEEKLIRKNKEIEEQKIKENNRKLKLKKFEKLKEVNKKYKLIFGSDPKTSLSHIPSSLSRYWLTLNYDTLYAIIFRNDEIIEDSFNYEGLKVANNYGIFQSNILTLKKPNDVRHDYFRKNLRRMLYNSTKSFDTKNNISNIFVSHSKEELINFVNDLKKFSTLNNQFINLNSINEQIDLEKQRKLYDIIMSKNKSLINNYDKLPVYFTCNSNGSNTYLLQCMEKNITRYINDVEHRSDNSESINFDSLKKRYKVDMFKASFDYIIDVNGLLSIGNFQPQDTDLEIWITKRLQKMLQGQSSFDAAIKDGKKVEFRKTFNLIFDFRD